VTLTFDLLISKLKGFRDSSWNICKSCLLALAASFFKDIVRKKQTRRLTGVKTLSPRQPPVWVIMLARIRYKKLA